MEGVAEIKRPIPKSKAPPLFPLSRSANSNEPKLWDFHPEEIARQMCMCDSDLIYSIRSADFVARSWENRQSSVRSLLARARAFKQWAIDEILKEMTMQAKKQLIGGLVHLGRACLELRHFNATHAILGVVQSSEFRAAMNSCEELMPKTSERLEELLASAAHFESLRTFDEWLRPADEPFIPPMAVLVADVGTFGDQIPDFIDGLLNVDKWWALIERIGDIAMAQSRVFNFEKIDFIQKVLRTIEEDYRAVSEEEQADAMRSRDISTVDRERLKMALKSYILQDQSDLQMDIITMFKQSLKDKIAFESIEKTEKSVEEELKVLYSRLLVTSAGLHDALNSAVSSRYSGTRIQSWSLQDESGFVYGWPELISLEYVPTNDNNQVLVIGRVSIDKCEVSTAMRIRQFYREKTGNSNARIMIVGNYVSEDVLIVAKDVDVDIVVQ